MTTEIETTIEVTEEEAQYDVCAKRILSNSYIIAHILAKTVDEFKKMGLEDIMDCIEGEPLVGVVPIEPGVTNKKNGQRVVGFNSENAEINEGLIRFDIVFYVRMKDGLSQMIINIEAQKDEPSDYDILNRAIFYVSRLISSQKERNFINSNFDDIKQVFSIWICMNLNENCMNHVHLVNDKLIGSYEWQGNIDLLNIVMIGLSENLPEHNEKYELHHLLGTLLSMELSADKKLNIIKREYYIPTDELEKEVNVMCNLSQGILEKGREEGREEGRKEIAKIILHMHEKGLTIEQIVDIVGKDIEEVKEIIED